MPACSSVKNTTCQATRAPVLAGKHDQLRLLARVGEPGGDALAALTRHRPTCRSRARRRPRSRRSCRARAQPLDQRAAHAEEAIVRVGVDHDAGAPDRQAVVQLPHAHVELLAAPLAHLPHLEVIERRQAELGVEVAHVGDRCLLRVAGQQRTVGVVDVERLHRRRSLRRGNFARTAESSFAQPATDPVATANRAMPRPSLRTNVIVDSFLVGSSDRPRRRR